MPSIVHSRYDLWGPDVSHWQGQIDWNLLGKKANFVIIRAGDSFSGGNLDSRWVSNWSQAKGKIARGAYWFFRSGIDPLQQVEWIANAYQAIGNDFGELGFYIDLEKDGSRAGMATYTSVLVKFLAGMDELLKTKCPKVPLTGIYTSYGWWNPRVNPEAIPNLNDRNLWPAQWFFNETSAPRQLPTGWHGWTFWQFSAQGNARDFIGSAPGAGRALDLNVFNGTMDQFTNHFGIDMETLPPPPVDNRVVVGFKPSRPGMNVRNKPTTFGSAVLMKTTLEVLPVLAVEKDDRGEDWYLIGGNKKIPMWISSSVGTPILE